MIKKILFENFKGFKKAEIELKPITVLIGPNNAGKSTILESLALLKQTAESKTSDVLKFKKGYLDFDKFETVVHKNLITNYMRFQITFDDNTFFDTKIICNNGIEDIVEYSCNTGKIKYDITEIENVDGEYQFKIKLVSSNISESLNLEQNFQNFKIVRDNFLFHITYQVNIDTLLSLMEALKMQSAYSGKKNSIKSRILQTHGTDLINELLSFQDMTREFNINTLEKIRQIRHIGPSRESPSRSYNYGDYSHVGYYGQNTPQIISSTKEKEEQLSELLKTLDIAKKLKIKISEPELKNFFELCIGSNDSEENFNIIDVGFGISQILPLIVEILQLDDNSLLLIEQPESHVHPNVQQKLTNFIAKTFKLKSKKKVILETHSEYILERIRTLIMKTEIQLSDICIYYVDFDKNENYSCIEEIKINQNGSFEHVPDLYPSNFSDKENADQLNIFFTNYE